MAMEGGALRRLNERSRDSASVPGSPLHLQVRASLSKKFQKSIDTRRRNFVSHADASKTNTEFYPVNSLFVWSE